MSDTPNVGNDQGQSNPGTDTSQAQPQGQGQTPTPISLNDDSLVTYEGAKEPIKFSNLKGLQSQFTKVSQAKAQFEKQARQQAAELAQARQALAQYQRQSQGQPPDPFAEIKGLPYLSGQDAAGVLSKFKGEFTQRDQILMVIAQKLLNLEKNNSVMSRERANQQFETKIKTALTNLGLDPDYADDAKAFYLAHEGDDLDEVFPDLYKQHVEKRRAIEARVQAKAKETARLAPFVPGKGGLGSTTGQADFAGKSAKEQADMLWGLIQSGDSGKT